MNFAPTGFLTVFSSKLLESEVAFNSNIKHSKTIGMSSLRIKLEITLYFKMSKKVHMLFNFLSGLR